MLKKKDDPPPQPTVAENQKPTASNLTSPADKATGVVLDSKLSWEAGSDPDGDALTYTVLLGKNNPPTDTVSKNQSSLSYKPKNQAGNTQYYWRVIADDGKATAASTVRTYTTNRPPPTPPPTSPSTPN